MKPCIVLQSDFGLSTGLPASMTAVIVRTDPELRVYDLCHEVREYDIREASQLLGATFPFWPDGTIFVSVVDPGVGTARKSIVARMNNGSYVVTPDNGTISCLYDEIESVREIDEKVNRLPGSDEHHTFHGRDVYAYTAARLASGIIDFTGVGPEMIKEDLVRFPLPTAEIKNGKAYGEVIGAHDHFGNVSISIPNEMIKAIGISTGEFCRLQIIKEGKILYDREMLFHKSFGYVDESQPILNESSNDYVELSLNKASFCEREMPELLGTYDLSAYKVVVTPLKKAGTNRMLVMQTDFGVGGGSAMRGTALKVDPELDIYEAGHYIEKFNVVEASRSLRSYVSYWPAGTVFVSVVDPGVGTSRRASIARLKNGSYVVTPDNGSLTLLLEQPGIEAIRVIDETKNRLKGTENVSIFHGRDLFAYCGAKLAAGIIDFEGVGPEYPVEEIVTYNEAGYLVENGRITGYVTDVMKNFGNLETNIPVKAASQARLEIGKNVKVIIRHEGETVYNAAIPYQVSFGYVETGKELLYNSSDDVLGIGINLGDFIRRYNIGTGLDWTIEISREDE